MSDNLEHNVSYPLFTKLAGGENDQDWKFGMELYLRDMNLWYAVIGYPTDDKTDETTKKKYDQRALTKIGLMVQPCCYPHVHNCEAAKDMWIKEYQSRIDNETWDLVDLKTNPAYSSSFDMVMLPLSPSSTLMEPNLKPKYPTEDERKNDPDIPYRNLIGCLMYIAINTRPDIAHVSSVLSQFNNCYTEEHWKYAKRILRYLKKKAVVCAINPPELIL
ncbi:hypothetical protein JTB14_024265 [Gonioctena quinquepunctata]|nr:hypothetical protein JTB14_024265 [Gonioctena quinquepunctata]